LVNTSFSRNSPRAALSSFPNPAVEQAMNAGEAAFARRNFGEALKDYSKNDGTCLAGSVMKKTLFGGRFRE
jgi:hypothetical protein